MIIIGAQVVVIVIQFTLRIFAHRMKEQNFTERKSEREREKTAADTNYKCFVAANGK